MTNRPSKITPDIIVTIYLLPIHILGGMRNDQAHHILILPFFFLHEQGPKKTFHRHFFFFVEYIPRAGILGRGEKATAEIKSYDWDWQQRAIEPVLLLDG